MDSKEGFFTNARSHKIYWKSWLPSSQIPDGILIFVHGWKHRLDEQYELIAAQMVDRGFACYGIDHQGFGRSEGVRSWIENFAHLVDDVVQFRGNVAADLDHKYPGHRFDFFLFGESMGGAISILTSIRAPHLWKGMLLFAPMCMIDPAVQPPSFVLKLVSCLASVIPRARLVYTKDIGHLGCKDKTRLERVERDVYRDKSRWTRVGTGMQMLTATKIIEATAPRIEIPFVLFQGTQDHLTPIAGGYNVHRHASSPDKMMVTYEGGFHALFWEAPELRRCLFHDIESWLIPRLSAQHTGQAVKSQRSTSVSREFDLPSFPFDAAPSGGSGQAAEESVASDDEDEPLLGTGGMKAGRGARNQSHARRRTSGGGSVVGSAAQPSAGSGTSLPSLSASDRRVSSDGLILIRRTQADFLRFDR